MKYEVYENNGGAVMLAILDDDCKPAAIFENWEYGQRGILADALQELAADPTAWRAWDSDPRTAHGRRGSQGTRPEPRG